MPHVEQELITLPEPPVLSGVRAARSLVPVWCFVDRFCSVFLCLLCCLSSSDERFLVTPLVSSNFFQGAWINVIPKGLVILLVIFNNL